LRHSPTPARRATIDDAVVILGVYYGGRDFETLLAESPE
jgi:hypothetical protein